MSRRNFQIMVCKLRTNNQEASEQVMADIHELTFFKISTNCFVAPRGRFLGKAFAFPQGAKFVNIPDIHRVLRLGDRSRHRPTSSIHGVVAFGVFRKKVYSHGSSPRLIQRLPK
jgi:hypothetical protein